MANFRISSDVLVFNQPVTNADGFIYVEADSLFGTTVSPHTDPAYAFGDKLFRGVYNGGDIFADTLEGYSWIPGGVWDYYASPVAGEVSSMQAFWSVNVSSGGHASGLAQFHIDGDLVPEPATLCLLGLGGLLLRRKRSSPIND